jgi:[ribosomal protein S18]-alanine N-acetyltransferase
VGTPLKNRGRTSEAPFRIREYHPDDLDELYRIDQQCFSQGIAYSREELAHYIKDPSSFTLVAESSAASEKPKIVNQQNAPEPAAAPQVVGFIVAQKLRRGMGHVITIDVLPEARRAQLGSQLMSDVERRLCAGGCRNIFLEVAVDNRPAILFYKRHGYFVVKTIPRYYDGKLDALLMAKTL